MTQSRDALTRRQLFGMVFGGAAVGGVLAVGKRSSPALLRPPGAQSESDFLAACIRCGQCVEACPYDALKLATSAQGAAAGTPYLVARQTPCYLCQNYDDLLCIAACPTDALQPVAENSDVRMGVAVIDENTCLAFNDVICRACWHACPFPDAAIELDLRGRAFVHPQACVGCGLCERACITEPSSIVIIPTGDKVTRRQGDKVTG